MNGPKGKGLGVLCADFNGDAWPDILITNDLMANHLWINQHDGSFKEEATLARRCLYAVRGSGEYGDRLA